MNKKQKIISRRKVVQLSAAFFALTLVLGACKKDETDIGDGLQDANLDIVFSDTFSIVTYSEEIVDMESDETSINMLGAYVDPVFGSVDCGFVTQIVPEALSQSFPATADITMDSVVLALRYSSINFYANLDDITVEVFEIDDVLERADTEYLVSEEPTIIGEDLVLDGMNTLTPDFISNQIVGNDTLSPQMRIHLDPQVGMDFIVDAESNLLDANFQTNTFKGLYVKVNMPGLATGKGTVLYFALENLLSKLTMYYHDSSDNFEEFDFLINSSCARYNKITFDRTGTGIDEAVADQSKGEEAFYMQGGAIRGVIQFPHITNFYTDSDGNFDPKIINKAELVLPIQDFQPDVFDPATEMFIARIVDERLSTFTEDYGFGSTLNGNTVNYDEDNREFRFVMTQEIQALLNGDIENVGYRVYSPSFFASTVERIIFNGSNTTLKEKPRLEITYTEY